MLIQVGGCYSISHAPGHPRPRYQGRPLTPGQLVAMLWQTGAARAPAETSQVPEKGATMASRLGRHKGAALLLFIVLLVAIGIFGAPARYSMAVSAALTIGQLVLMGGAALTLVLPAWHSGDEYRRSVAIAGMLLIVPWALLTLMPGYGPPFAANLAMNHVRFVVLFVSTAFLGAGLLVLNAPLTRGETGDRLLAPLGQASGLLAVGCQLIWAAILIGWTMSEARKPANYLPMYGTPLGNASDVLLFFAGLMTYVATAFYAFSFMRRGWLPRIAAWVMAIIAAIAVAGLVARGLQYPDLSEQWFTMPGMIVGIPAIPWVMPYVLGVVALVHAAKEEGSDVRL